MTRPLPAAILFSGTGSNLVAIAAKVASGHLPLDLRLAASDRADAPGLARAAEFGEGRAISDRDMLAGLLVGIGEDAAAVLARAESADNKAALKAAVEEAKALGLPGAPCIVIENREVFWGNDRLEQALDWALRG